MSLRKNIPFEEDSWWENLELKYWKYIFLDYALFSTISRIFSVDNLPPNLWSNTLQDRFLMGF